MKAKVHVMLKEGVLDPQGEAIKHSLGSMGFSGVDGVRQGKVIELDLADGTDEATILTTPIRHTLEQALEFIEDDELVEVTPLNIRIRKKFLLEHERKKAARGK